MAAGRFPLPRSVPKRLGIFGGTFDPVHHGHLILARDALEHFELDEMLFVPAAVSPHRTEQPPMARVARHLVGAS